MSVMDVAALLAPVSEASPCGDDLEYDLSFGDLERARQGKPEQQFGDTVIPAEEPDWRQVKKLSLELFGRTRDLRVGVTLACALVHLEGLPGLRDGLHLVRGLVEQYWDAVHPRLDPEDDNDPTLRVNTLATLCDEQAVLKWVREAPLVEVRGLGRFSLRDVQIAKGAVELPAGVKTVEPAAIEAAFKDADVAQLQATLGVIQEAIQHARAIETLLTDRVGTDQSADLSALPKLLQDAQGVLTGQLSYRGVGEAPPGEAIMAETVTETGALAQAAAQPRFTGAIQSRDDALRALEAVCRYFEHAEPSSPVPLLLRRAKRLVPMRFLDIVKDLAPDGLGQVELIRGPEVEPASGTSSEEGGGSGW